MPAVLLSPPRVTLCGFSPASRLSGIFAAGSDEVGNDTMTMVLLSSMLVGARTRHEARRSRSATGPLKDYDCPEEAEGPTCTCSGRDGLRTSCRAEVSYVAPMVPLAAQYNDPLHMGVERAVLDSAHKLSRCHLLQTAPDLKHPRTPRAL